MNIIPKPLKIKEKPGQFQLNSETRILIVNQNPELIKITKFLVEAIKKTTNFIIPIVKGISTNNTIEFKISATDLGLEGYSLLVEKDRIILIAEAANGIFYGLQTLLQMLPPQIMSQEKIKMDWKIPCCKIEDKPRFSWRGMHLDVSRHFFGIDFIKKYIALLAMHKLNIFHWHLTDDNGWRIEIKNYPQLTKICSWRKNLEHIPWNERDNSNDPGNGIYGGFYTRDEIKEIVQYARNRFITVVPEIEMPGHSREVFAAYPQFSCKNEEATVAPGGYWPNMDIFCAGKDETFEFLKNILTEIIELFPSQYIHIGGDEANKTHWKECPLCQQRIKEENLKDEKELQSWFIKQIADFLTSKNRKLIGWDEIAEGGLIDEATVMCWRGDGIDAAKNAVKKGCNVIMCPNPFLYFDWKQNEDDNGAFGVTTLRKVYNYDPVPECFSYDETKSVLGAQGNVWTEWMPTEEKVEYMALPRMSALAELVWVSKENKNYPDFKKRLDNLIQIFNLISVNFNEEF